ncbi:ABC transporter permease [uncultured Draconibacterium sp.]|uniref:ABC transporter permease n=1 Tax=uncultured Draconibacterium sp. TaxID=1573823 RepID=UPI0025D60226|nr:ABC transporter permease [uncultured Draconibacterium sp.]
MYTILKSYFRNFKKQKLIYSITIGGFAVSLAVLVLIVSFIIEEKSVDKHYPHIDNMYRIKQSDENLQIPKRIYEEVMALAPEIENMCILNRNGVLYNYNDKKDWTTALATDENFLDVFSVDIVKGQKEDLFLAKSDVLITEEFAQKVFGEKNPIGEIIEFGDMEEKAVKAVIATPLKTSSLKYDVVFNLEQNIWKSYRGYNEEKYYLYDMVFYLNQAATPSETESKIKDILKSYEGYEQAELMIQPFKEIYFDKSRGDSYVHANVNMIKLLAIIAIIILVLAIFNYINLSTAFNNERFKEICIRKTSGARTKTIFYQFVGESYIAFLVALILSLVIASVLSPIFEELFNRKIDLFEALKQPSVLLAVAIIFLVIGLISGLIPALVAAKFNPVDLLQRNIKLKNSGFRGVYNTIQISVTVALIICLLTINKQIRYVKTKDVGFEKELLLEIGLQGKARGKADIIKEKLLNNPQIINVSGTHGLPFSIYSYGSGSWISDSVEYEIDELVSMNTDTSFLSTFGVNLVMGRNFRVTDKEACIINKKTYDYLQMNTIEGQEIWGKKIVGVVEDFHFKNMHEELGYLQMNYVPDEVSHLNIRIAGNNLQATLMDIQNTLKEFEPSMTNNPRFYDDWINTMYQKEEQQAKAIKIYSLMALFLSCLGLLGMAEFASVKRTKEIGIRKVNGAKVSEILSMLNKDFIRWVVIAFVIATPVAYYAMNKWLENFAYKTTLSWWIFALAGVLALGIALLTVSWQSWRAATRNPVEALRYE